MQSADLSSTISELPVAEAPNPSCEHERMSAAPEPLSPTASADALSNDSPLPVSGLEHDDTFDTLVEVEETGRLPLNRLAVGTWVNGQALLRQKESRLTKAGAPYWTLTLGNAEGTAVGKVWTQRYEQWEQISVGAPVWVSAEVKDGWQGAPPELHIASVMPLPPGHPVSLEMNPASAVPLPQLIARFEALLESLTPAGQALVLSVMRIVGWDLFIEAPGAAGHHHAYIHGLLEHSVEVTEMAVALGQVSAARDGISWDAVIAGALCHDIGKVSEYVWRGLPIAIDKRRFAVTYHTASGQLIVERAWTGDRGDLVALGVTPELVEHMQHVIESHHATKEHGSLTPPCSVEAALVSAADEASARVSARWADAMSARPDDDNWVTPLGYRKAPVWRLTSDTAATLPSATSAYRAQTESECDPSMVIEERWARLLQRIIPTPEESFTAGAAGQSAASSCDRAALNGDALVVESSEGGDRGCGDADGLVIPRVPLASCGAAYTDAEREEMFLAYVCWLVRKDAQAWDVRRTLRREHALMIVDEIEAALPDSRRERLERLLAAA